MLIFHQLYFILQILHNFLTLYITKFVLITPKTFYLKMKKGVFGSNEIEIMIEKLHIQDPASIFFAREVT